MKSAVALLSFLYSAMLPSSLVHSFAIRSAIRAGRRCAAGGIVGGIGGSTSCQTSSSLHPLSTPSRTLAGLPTTRRWMSTPSEEQTSVVETCREKIAAALETEDVRVVGAYDDPNGSHISIEVTSALFEGKRPVQRQQLVYKALWEELQGAVHAVDSMVCRAPDEK